MPTPDFPAITPLSVLHFLRALLWASAIFLAVAGYGAALLSAFRFKRPNFAIAATVGFAPAVFLGGLLNLLHLIYPPVLIGFVAVGLILVVLLLRPKPSQSLSYSRWTPAVIAMTAALTLVSGVRITATVHTPYFQPLDDLNYYYAAPEKIIQMHFFAADPYSERRITSSIGGNQFLTTLVLATQRMESEGMADWTLGAFLLLGLGSAIRKEFELTPLQGTVFAFLLMIMPQIRLNLTFVILPSALFLGLAYLAAHRWLTANRPVLQAILIGATVGALSSMKSNYITHGVIFVLCLTVLRWWKRGSKAAALSLAFSALACLITMLPWMVASKQTCGTFFYPLLGKGVHFSAYGQYLSPIHFETHIFLTKVLPFNLPILALALIEWFLCGRGELEERSYVIITFTFAAFIASVIVGQATGGDSVRRYNFPCVLPAVCLFFVLCARRANLPRTSKAIRSLQLVAAILIAAVAINVGMSQLTNEYRHTPAQLRASLADFHLANAALRDRYARMQASIPYPASSPNGVLTSLENSFLLDFRRRDIFLADFPGDASPKPGWPARQPGDALANFLLQHNIRYLAYSYDECDLHPPHRNCHDMLEYENQKSIRNPDITALIRGEVESGYDARKQYGELAATRRHIYDDGRIYVLDLLSKP